MRRHLLSATAALAFAAPTIGCIGDDLECDPDQPGTICTVAGNGLRGRGEENRPALEIRLDVPQDMVIAPNGNLWVIDFNNYMVKEILPDGIMHTIIGSGLLGDSPPPDEENILASQALFNHTTDLFFHEGYLYLAAWHNSRIKRVDLQTMMLENYAGIGRRTLYSGDEGPRLEAALDLPSAIAVDPLTDNIVVMDQANQVIRMIDKDGIIHRIAGSCVIDLFTPCGDGQVPTACPDSNKTTCGDPATECGKECTPSYAGDQGPAIEARINQPFGQMAAPAGRLVYDQAGNLYFADTGNHRIRMVDTDGIMSTVAGTGTAGYSGDGGMAIDAQINSPVDIEVGADGSIYFADTENSCVRRITSIGTIETVAGMCSADPADRGFSGDGGDPTHAQLDRPFGIELHGDKMWIADSYNNRIRVVNF